MLGDQGRQPTVREAVAVVWAECQPIEGRHLVPPTQRKGHLRETREVWSRVPG